MIGAQNLHCFQLIVSPTHQQEETIGSPVSSWAHSC